MRKQDILFIEDDEDDVFMLKHVCKKLGVEAASFAENGRRAIEHLSPFLGRNGADYPLIFLDINMPEMNGFDFLRWLRKEASLVSVPVIMLSTSENPRDIHMAYELGANAYLVKSNTMEDLATMLGAAHTFWSRFNRLPKA